METSLTHLQQSFAAWQSSTKKRHVSAALREQAVKCLEHHTYQEVSEVIGRCTKTLKLWQTSLRCEEVADSPPAFVAMNLESAQKTDKAEQASFTLQINLSNGILINVKPESMAASVGFIVALNRESNACSI
jgi:lysozyme family protein